MNNDAFQKMVRDRAGGKSTKEIAREAVEAEFQRKRKRGGNSRNRDYESDSDDEGNNNNNNDRDDDNQNSSSLLSMVGPYSNSINSTMSNLTLNSSYTATAPPGSAADITKQPPRSRLDIERCNRQCRKRRSKAQHKVLDEIRSGTEFTTIQCIVAIVTYLVFAIVCYNYIFEPDGTIIDSIYFAVTTFSKFL